MNDDDVNDDIMADYIPSQMEDRRENSRRGGQLEFNRWRRNVLIAFVMLTTANVAGMAWLYDTRHVSSLRNKDRQDEISSVLVEAVKGNKRTLLKICAIDNAQNKAVREILEEFDIPAKQFKAISCKNLVTSVKLDDDLRSVTRRINP